MRRIGMYMALFGLFAIVLNFFDRVPRLLMWIYDWGDTVAWIIKIGLILVGGILFFAAKMPKEQQEVSEETPAE